MLDGLRPVVDDDAEALQTLIRVCWDAYPGCILDIDREEPWLRAPATATAAKGALLWVVPAHGPAENPLAASVALYPSAESGVAELKTLYVWPTERRGGLGAALVAHAETVARVQRGATRMVLWSDTRFVEAHRLYDRLGYRRGATRELGDLSNTVEYFFERPLA